MVQVANRTESECFKTVCYHLVKILHATQRRTASKNRTSKVAEELGTIWVARRTESECFAVVCNCLFEIIHPS